MAQWVKDLALSLLWFRLLLWCQFDSWPRNFHMLWTQLKKKKKKKKKKGEIYHVSKYRCQVDSIHIWDAGERSELEIKIGESSEYKLCLMYLRPSD